PTALPQLKPQPSPEWAVERGRSRFCALLTVLSGVSASAELLLPTDERVVAIVTSSDKASDMKKALLAWCERAVTSNQES
ncbi:MAG: hypothetical protein E6534_06695, partial [Corynebacterium kroppenstedtii]|nr:hypothetical protein [Corynebacterium kroppenstedtii]